MNYQRFAVITADFGYIKADTASVFCSQSSNNISFREGDAVEKMGVNELIVEDDSAGSRGRNIIYMAISDDNNCELLWILKAIVLLK